MKFVKNNILFLIFSGLFCFIFILLLISALFYSGAKDEANDKLAEIKRDINNLHNQMLPYVGLEHDLKLAAADLDELASIERGQNRLWKLVLAPEANISLNWEPKSEEVINSTLIRQFTRLSDLCREKNVVLPGNNDEGPSSPFGDQSLKGIQRFWIWYDRL